jgi:hypothetical protein
MVAQTFDWRILTWTLLQTSYLIQGDSHSGPIKSDESKYLTENVKNTFCCRIKKRYTNFCQHHYTFVCCKLYEITLKTRRSTNKSPERIQIDNSWMRLYFQSYLKELFLTCSLGAIGKLYFQYERFAIWSTSVEIASQFIWSNEIMKTNGRILKSFVDTCKNVILLILPFWQGLHNLIKGRNRRS